MDPVSRALQVEQLASKAELARKLLDKQPAFAGIAPRTLAVYLGHLQQGNATWWQRHPRQLDAFCTYAGLDPDDLGALQRVRPDTMHAFPTFPALPPLDLTRESPASLHEDVAVTPWPVFDPAHWYEPASARGIARPVPGLYWLQIPPGCGLDLLWQTCRVRAHADCIEADTLDDVKRLPTTGRPCVIRLAHAPEAGALERFDDIAAAVLVVSRHAPPPHADADGVLRLRAMRRNPSLLGAMQRTLRPDWRQTLASWIIERRPQDSHLDQAELDRWCRRLAPVDTPIDTPRALLTVCGLLHRLPTYRSVNLLEAEGGRAFLEASIQQRTLAQRLTRMLRQRYLADGDWGTPLSPEGWQDPSTTRTIHSRNLQSELAGIVKAPSRAQRERQAKALLARCGEASLSELLHPAGLARDADGRYSMQLALAADLVGADAVCTLLDAGDIAGWARCCLDPQRRRAAEIALWRRVSDVLASDLDRMLATELPAILRLAAEDAMFHNWGVRLAQAAAPEVALSGLQALGARVLARERDIPWTRHVDTPDDVLVWRTVCAAWSFALPLPISAATPDPGRFWQFPGWVPATAEAVDGYSAYDLPALSDTPRTATAQYESDAWRLWWPVSERITNRFTKMPVDPPAPMAPALLLRTLANEESVPAALLWWTLHMPSARLPLEPLIATLPAAARELLLDAVLDVVSRSHHSVALESPIDAAWRRLETDALAASWLAQAALRGLDDGAVVTIAGPERFQALLQCLHADSGGALTALAQALPLSNQWASTCLALLPMLPANAWPVVADWLGHIADARLAGWLWQHDPMATLSWLAQAQSSTAAVLLVQTTPNAQVAAVAALLADTASPALRDCRLEWMATRLPDHGIALQPLVDALDVEGWL